MIKQNKIKPPFKIYGSKWYLHSWIIKNFPVDYENMVYIEPFCGAASTFMNKKSSTEEILNDLDKGIVAILRIIRDQPEEFKARLSKIKYNKKSFEEALAREPKDEIELAINEFILRKMSRGGLKQVLSLSGDTWKVFIKTIPTIAARLEKTFIFNKPAIKILSAFNESNVLAYVDPPAKESEMTMDDHVNLANFLKVFKGKVVVSGNPSAFYNKIYKSWKCIKNKNIKTECLWINT